MRPYQLESFFFFFLDIWQTGKGGENIDHEESSKPLALASQSESMNSAHHRVSGVGGGLHCKERM